MPWVFGGDFNIVLDLKERKDGDCVLSYLRSFKEFTLKAKVVDFPMQESCFTWSNNRERASWERLDRFLVSPIILSWFPNLIQKDLPINLSDHNTITIGESCMDWGPIPFRGRLV
ncbi:hypothetical protein Dsin_021281 [Dipteronia sinensis]|uniref:Endonuclease/exonuclease/phosphatase domain-containing protein n=1 Tax=Dipteronia sinensis TaxID=43782 RepID=A0AAE0A0N1_9ROSI|nr:hypothetical protein Dsin_021281 [Dipteronia sinensis]